MKKSRIDELWHDPVWSKVIAACILFAAGAIWSYFYGWWPSIGRGIGHFISWTQTRTPVPNWLLVILSISMLLLLAFGAIVLWRFVIGEQLGASWRSYTKDELFGIRWRWDYDGVGSIYGLHPFCPACDYQIYARNASAYDAVDRIAFRCEDCGQVLGEFNMSPEAMENRVIRAIQKNLRNGTWRKLKSAQ